MVNLYRNFFNFFIYKFCNRRFQFQEPAQLTSSKFNNYLEKGQIEKVIVYNKAEAEVYLKPQL